MSAGAKFRKEGPGLYRVEDGAGVLGWIERDMFGDGWWLAVEPIGYTQGIGGIGLAGTKAEAADRLEAYWLRRSVL